MARLNEAVALPAAADDLAALAPLAAELPPGDDEAVGLLYERWYLDAGGVRAVDAPERRPGLAGLFRSAHPAAERWSPGWEALEADREGWVLCRRDADGPARIVAPGGWTPVAGPGVPVASGDPIVVREAVEQVTETGYWVTQSHPAGFDGPVLRVYLHATAAGVPVVVRELLHVLDSAGRGSWSVKALVDPQAYRRPDAVVAYLDAGAVDAAGPLLPELAALFASAELLRAPIPRCTAPLGPGMAWAEDPGDGESFGINRCRLALAGLRAAGPQAAAPDVVEAVRAAFDGVGIDPDAPHRSPGNGLGARLLHPASAPRAVRRARVVTPVPAALPAPVAPTDPGLPVPGPPYETAKAIARRLVAEHRLADGGPVWCGRDVVPGDGPDGIAVAEVDLGDSLYSGRAGIAWFLAGAARVLGDTSMARLALAAADGALAGSEGHGLLTGAAGAAVAAAEVGGMLGDHALQFRAREAADTIATRAANDAGPGRALPHGRADLLDGVAGTLLAALTVPGAERRRGAANALGDALVAAADRSPTGWTWPGADGAALCGLSHGGAGVALALAALGARTDGVASEAFTEAALWAVRAERANHDPARGWPDLRPGVPDGSAPVLWCHGAAGIGLARLATLRWLAGRRGTLVEALTAECRADATAAIARARVAARELVPLLGEDGVDLSLCHGAGGIVELLLVAAEVTGHRAHQRAAYRVAAAVAYAASRTPVACGLPDRSEALGLFLGLAGIGATALRASTPGALRSPALLGASR